jgi:hypothetical protein
MDFSKEDDEKIAKKGWLKINHYGVTTTQDVMMMRYFLYCNLIFVTQSFVAGILLFNYVYNMRDTMINCETQFWHTWVN